MELLYFSTAALLFLSTSSMISRIVQNTDNLKHLYVGWKEIRTVGKKDAQGTPLMEVWYWKYIQLSKLEQK